MSTLNQASDYIHDAADYLHNAADYMHENADKIAHATGYAVGALGEKGARLSKAEQKLMKHCSSYAKDHPMKSLAIAAAVGFMLNRLLKNH